MTKRNYKTRGELLADINLLKVSLTPHCCMDIPMIAMVEFYPVKEISCFWCALCGKAISTPAGLRRGAANDKLEAEILANSTS